MGSQVADATLMVRNECKSMHKGKSEPSEYHIKDNEGMAHKIEQVQQEKDLGVIFDEL